jgi:hypothetical protein
VDTIAVADHGQALPRHIGSQASQQKVAISRQGVAFVEPAQSLEQIPSKQFAVHSRRSEDEHIDRRFGERAVEAQSHWLLGLAIRPGLGRGIENIGPGATGSGDFRQRLEHDIRSHRVIGIEKPDIRALGNGNAEIPSRVKRQPRAG